MRKHLHYWLAIPLFLVFFFSYQDILSHVVYFHGQHQLFLYTSDYFHSHDLLTYLTAFLIQFFRYPLLGSLVMAAVLVAIYLLSWRLLTLLAGREDVIRLSLIPALSLYVWTSTLDHSLQPVTATLLVLLIAVVLTIPLWRKRKIKAVGWSRKLYILITLAVLTGYSAVSACAFLRTFSISEYRMLKAQEAVDNEDWDGVLLHTTRYLDYQKRANPLILYFRNMALYHKGELLNRLFDYPPANGVSSLYFPWQSRTRETEFGHYLLEQLGCVNDAQHWEFEAMVVWGETAPRLLNLARYAIASGNGRVAQRYINRLRKSLFYRGDVADALQRDLERGRVTGLRAPLADVREAKANFINVRNIGPNLEYLLQHDPNNRMAYEYLMSDLLLSNHLNLFGKHLAYYRRYGYKSLPRLLDEALVVYELSGKTVEGVKPSAGTQQRFERYCQLASMGDRAALSANFGNTYWYYLNYVSPYGNKIKQ